MLYKTRTQYYNGTGSQKLLLKNRPVFTNPAIQVWEDSNGYWGATSGAFTNTNSLLTYGSDYALQIDQDDNSSRSGMLVRIRGYWQRNFARAYDLLAPFRYESFGSIKVTYTAGYTVDTLPAGFRQGANLLIAKMNYLFPLGMTIGSETYQDRSISFNESQRQWLLGLIRPHIESYRNWHWG